jgi:hypothetical protein
MNAMIETRAVDKRDKVAQVLSGRCNGAAPWIIKSIRGMDYWGISSDIDKEHKNF